MIGIPGRTGSVIWWSTHALISYSSARLKMCQNGSTIDSISSYSRGEESLFGVSILMRHHWHRPQAWVCFSLGGGGRWCLWGCWGLGFVRKWSLVLCFGVRYGCNGFGRVFLKAFRTITVVSCVSVGSDVARGGGRSVKPVSVDGDVLGVGSPIDSVSLDGDTLCIECLVCSLRLD